MRCLFAIWTFLIKTTHESWNVNSVYSSVLFQTEHLCSVLYWYRLRPIFIKAFFFFLAKSTKLLLEYSSLATISTSAPVHKARSIKKWLAEEEVDWPAQSHDLNPSSDFDWTGIPILITQHQRPNLTAATFYNLESQSRRVEAFLAAEFTLQMSTYFCPHHVYLSFISIYWIYSTQCPQRARQT